jgi:AAA ATPase domain
VVSDVTARLVRGYVRLDALGPTDIRGRAGRVEVFRVVGPGPRRSPLEAIEDRPLSHFVGRDREIGVLSDLFHDVEAGRGQTVGLVGEPGVGKTRLLLEFQRRNAGRDVAYRESRCLSFGRAIPYGPVLDLVRAAAGLVDSEPLEASIDKLRLTLADLGTWPG